jgi:ABC-type transport system involved in Fe-S cluster assembly fused permease/ATPase subunit
MVPKRLLLLFLLLVFPAAAGGWQVTFSVPGGSTVAFVGATGSGKSTLTRLLFR